VIANLNATNLKFKAIKGSTSIMARTPRDYYTVDGPTADGYPGVAGGCYNN